MVDKRPELAVTTSVTCTAQDVTRHRPRGFVSNGRVALNARAHDFYDVAVGADELQSYAKARASGEHGFRSRTGCIRTGLSWGRAVRDFDPRWWLWQDGGQISRWRFADFRNRRDGGRLRWRDVLALHG